ncbi:Ribosomal RNA large subunit methyltransferase G [Pseudoclavibacter triregionum]|nr:Ribosomal RNA large subunit methyltransferase G [Pseudoclavibacter triregionum]
MSADRERATPRPADDRAPAERADDAADTGASGAQATQPDQPDQPAQPAEPRAARRLPRTRVARDSSPVPDPAADPGLDDGEALNGAAREEAELESDTAERPAVPDHVDARILDEAAELLAGTAPERLPSAPVVAVVGDVDGSLALGAAERLAPSAIRRHADALDAERLADVALASAGVEASVHGLEPALVAGADLVLARMPKSHEELRAIAELAAAHASPSVALVIGGREKHLHRSQNDVLGERFGSVRASLGKRKARALVASRPEASAATPHDDPAAAPRPRRARVVEPELGLDLEVVALGSAFAGPRLDLGTRALLRALVTAIDEADALELQLSAGARILDLGCGTGILAAAAAVRWPDAEVLASDRSWAAVESARATMAANGLEGRVRVERDVAAGSVPPRSVDLILCNPPFHEGYEVSESFAAPIFEGAGRALKPGGVMVTVFNSHLPHRSSLARLVGPTRQLARDPKFTVTLSLRRRPAPPIGGLAGRRALLAERGRDA